MRNHRPKPQAWWERSAASPPERLLSAWELLAGILEFNFIILLPCWPVPGGKAVMVKMPDYGVEQLFAHFISIFMGKCTGSNICRAHPQWRPQLWNKGQGHGIVHRSFLIFRHGFPKTGKAKGGILTSFMVENGSLKTGRSLVYRKNRFSSTNWNCDGEDYTA